MEFRLSLAIQKIRVYSFFSLNGLVVESSQTPFFSFSTLSVFMNFVNFVNIKTNFPCNQNQFPHQIYWSSHRMTFTIGSWNIYTIWDWAWAWAWADGFRRYYFLNVFAMSQTPQYENRPTTIWKMDVCKVPFPLPSELLNSIQLLLILFISQSLKPFTRVFIEKSTSKYTHFLILSLEWKKCLFSFRSYLHWVWNVRFVFASHSNEKVKKKLTIVT